MFLDKNGILADRGPDGKESREYAKDEYRKYLLHQRRYDDRPRTRPEPIPDQARERVD